MGRKTVGTREIEAKAHEDDGDWGKRWLIRRLRWACGRACGLVILSSPDPTTTLRILVCSPVCPQRLTPTHHVTWVSVPLVFSGVVPKGTQSEIERQEENIIVSITLPAFFLSKVWKCPCFSTCHLSFC